MKLLNVCRLFFLLCLLSSSAGAGDFHLPPEDIDLVGTVEYATARAEDTLLDIAREHSIGQVEILLANPKVDRWLPGKGTRVLIPDRYILPRAKREGVVLNVPEMRLYYFPPAGKDGRRRVETYPVSVGRMDWLTPLGDAKIVRKDKNPSWRPPESIKKEARAQGDPLPDVIPPGPDNPLGKYALRLSVPGYLIHSTNKPYGVGMRVTHGCLRMYPKDINHIFDRIPLGTPVQIVNQPIKLGWVGEMLFLEVHPALEEERVDYEALLSLTVDAVEKAQAERPVLISGEALEQIVEQQSGVPVLLSREPGIYD